MGVNATPLPQRHGDLNMGRRNYVDQQHPVETAIFEAAAKVETLGADLLLTQAGMKLQEAKELVSDWLEGKVGKFDANNKIISVDPE